jgi:hypothetical protein
MKYILIILFSLFSLSIQAQDTIKIPTPVAKQIVKDLVSGDGAKVELKLANENISLLEKKVVLKDSIINVWNYKGGIYEQQLITEKEKYKIQGQWVEDLRKQNKQLKTKLKFTQILGIAVASGLTYLYITK